MTDPTGTAGGSTPGAQGDMAAVYEGGASFMSRMKALGDLRDAQEAAFAKLKIGSDVHAALDAAQTKLAEAEAARALAAKVLDDAHRSAADAMATAKAEAKQIVADAKAQGAKTEAIAAERTRQADAYAKSTMGRADTAESKANALHEAATALETQNAEAGRLLALERAELAMAQTEADAARAKYESMIDRLKAAIVEIAG